MTSEGCGARALGAASAAELTAEPTTLAFGNARCAGWHRVADLVVRNVSTRPVARSRARPSHARRRRAVRVPRRSSAFTLPPGRRAAPPLDGAVAARAGRRRAAAEGASSRRRAAAPRSGLPGPSRSCSRRQRARPAQLSTDSFSPSDARARAADVPRRALVASGARRRSSPSLCCTLDLLTRRRHRPRHAGDASRPAPGPVRLRSHRPQPAGNTLGKGRYRIRVTAVPSLPGRPARRDDVHDSVTRPYTRQRIGP